MDIHDALHVFRESIVGEDWERAYYEGDGQQEPRAKDLDPMRCLKVRATSKSRLEPAFMLGAMAGVAIVADDRGRLAAIGRRTGAERWRGVWWQVRGATAPQLATAVRRQWERGPEPSRLPELPRVRAERIDLFTLRHKVAELYPALRDWAYRGPDEVRLFVASQGLQLGGVVNPLYTAGGKW